MKKITTKQCVLFILLVFSFARTYSQQKENDFVKMVASTTLNDLTQVKNILNNMNLQNNEALFKSFVAVFSNPAFQNSSTDVRELLSNYILNKDYFIDTSDTSLKRKSAIIFIYRTMVIDPNAKLGPAPVTGGPPPKGPGLSIDFSSLNTVIYNKDISGKLSNYLYATKNVLIVYVDASSEYYSQPDNTNNQPNQLVNSIVQINYKTSFFSQSFKDLTTLISSVGVLSSQNVQSPKLTLTFVLIDPKRIKDPCDIVIQNKTFAKDLTFSVHERNFASFQTGLVNNKYTLNNFSISNVNLNVTPDTTNWQSHIYALLEFHPWGRDIDNFLPLWKSLFSKSPDIIKNSGKSESLHNVWNWLMYNTAYRIGVYGGLQISKDPLSNLYAGFNYAVTKELSVNFGWVWANEVVPQVTEIGNITSVSDALQYAKRSYSKGKFSWGLSFAPSELISLLGIKSKASN